MATTKFNKEQQEFLYKALVFWEKENYMSIDDRQQAVVNNLINELYIEEQE